MEEKIVPLVPLVPNAKAGGGLAELLRYLRGECLWIDVDGEKASVRGGRISDEMRALLGEQRAYVIRIFRGGSTVWRKALRLAEAETQEAWAYVAAGHETAGMHPRIADRLAWIEVAE